MVFFFGRLTAIADWGASMRGGPGASAGYCLELPGELIFPFKRKPAPRRHRTRAQPCPMQVGGWQSTSIQACLWRRGLWTRQDDRSAGIDRFSGHEEREEGKLTVGSIAPHSFLNLPHTPSNRNLHPDSGVLTEGARSCRRNVGGRGASPALCSREGKVRDTLVFGSGFDLQVTKVLDN